MASPLLLAKQAKGFSFAVPAGIHDNFGRPVNFDPTRASKLVPASAGQLDGADFISMPESLRNTDSNDLPYLCKAAEAGDVLPVAGPPQPAPSPQPAPPPQPAAPAPESQIPVADGLEKAFNSSYLKANPVKPSEQVIFHFGKGFGNMSTWYHQVVVSPETITLVYDTRYEAGSQFEPPITESGQRLQISLADGRRFYAASPGLYFSFYFLNFYTLILSENIDTGSVESLSAPANNYF